MSFPWPHEEVLVELEAWGEGVLSAGDLVCPREEEASSAAGAEAGAGHGVQEVGGDDQVPACDDQGVEEVGMQLDFEELSLESDGASDSFPRRLFYVL